MYLEITIYIASCSLRMYTDLDDPLETISIHDQWPQNFIYSV